MVEKVKKIFKSNFVLNISKLMSGTIVAQLITFAALPVLARIYSKEAFGLLALFSAVVMFISSFATLKYDTALLLPKEDQDAYALLKLSNIVTIFITSISVLILSLPISFLGQYNDMAFLVGLGVLFNINYNNSALWNNRYNCFNYTAISKVLQAFFIFLFQFLFYRFFSLKGLIVGNLIGLSISGLYLIYTRKSNWKIYCNITIKDMKFQAKRYIDFPKYFTLSNAILSFSAHLPIFVFAKYMSLTQVGLYAIALKIIEQPVNLIASSMRSVILGEMVKKKRENKPILKWYRKLQLILFLISCMVSLFIMLFIGWFIDMFLGKDWSSVALYSKCLIPMFIGMMIAAPGIAAVRIFEMQKYNFKYSLFSMIFRIGALIGCVNFTRLNLEYIILIYSLLTLILIVINNIIITKEVVRYEKNLLSM